ncbi:alpha/beta hydrolase [Streptomyces sp. YIM 132580]|uniref:alpha/beta hydrolase n=1 Tax=Streptomyces sp. YIM 132580 TaxID=2691958 RepID=UPI00136B2CB3|nr:alpha/beta fold hydrolase [Streptomyces sp. YIM 132580]MXG25992.1 alpha/beta fold hydrolase [Streptomyces sp. YIM 132580]
MGTYVLVHGAMHGGWCWRSVRDLLSRAGHRVFTPSLTGQGEHAHLLGPDVGVATHVEDVAALLRYEDLSEVHLVLHSYAGVLAGPVAQRSVGRLASVTFLGAFLVRPGECLLDLEPPGTAQSYRALAAEKGDGWYLPADASFLDRWGITDEESAAWVAPRLTAFPLRCQTDAVDFDPGPLAALTTSYVRHTRPPLPSLELSSDRARDQGWDVHSLPTGHDMMLEAPEATTDLLTRITGREES